ncbi:DUF6690 family protein [Stieleria varia]|nr:DUF6690 family protein [Stieleria varia]
MPSYPLRLTGLLAIAALGPYLASETDFGRSGVSTVSNLFRGDGDSRSGYTAGGPIGVGGGPDSYANHAHYEVEKLRQVNSERYRYGHETARKLGAINADPTAEPTIIGARVADLREVMRFDITPDWVIARFARVSTVLADLQLKGMRVPVVTGTHATDFAGTLTYYFDAAGKLQRISLHGFTGDPSRLAQAMVGHYQLQSEPTLEAGVYTRRWNGSPIHLLRLTHAPVVYSDAVHHKYTMFLELNQMNSAHGISLEAQEIVTADHHTGRW